MVSAHSAIYMDPLIARVRARSAMRQSARRLTTLVGQLIWSTARDMSIILLHLRASPAGQPHRQYLDILREDLLRAAEGEEVAVRAVCAPFPDQPVTHALMIIAYTCLSTNIWIAACHDHGVPCERRWLPASIVSMAIMMVVSLQPHVGYMWLCIGQHAGGYVSSVRHGHHCFHASPVKTMCTFRLLTTACMPVLQHMC